jgi:hypothetical protein
MIVFRLAILLKELVFDAVHDRAAERLGVQLPRARDRGWLQKTNDLAREAVSWNAVLGCRR